MSNPYSVKRQLVEKKLYERKPLHTAEPKNYTARSTPDSCFFTVL